MVKPPKIRHSKSRKEPVTIDLDAGEVKRESEAAAGEAAAAAPEGVDPEQPVKPNAADEALADGETPPPNEQPAEATPDEAAGNGVRYGRAGAEPSGSLARTNTRAPALVAGVAGAVIALLGAAALQWTGALPAPRDEDAVDSASLDVLRAEIETLKQEIVADAGAAPDAALVQALAESNDRIDGLAATVEQLAAEVAAQEPQPLAADPGALQALEARLSQLEQAVESAGGDGAASEDLARQVDQLAANIDSLAEEAAGRSARLDALEQQIGEMAERVEAQAAEPGVALALAATALKSAIDRGEPFMAELQTYAAMAPDMPQIAALRELAANGVPTRDEIEAAIPDATERMVAAAAPPADENAGFLERMFTSAQSLVEVRPVGSVEGNSPGAIVARMEVALRQGDYAAAIKEFESLPEPAQAAGREFIDKVRARHAADRLIAEALAGAAKTPGSEG